MARRVRMKPRWEKTYVKACISPLTNLKDDLASDLFTSAPVDTGGLQQSTFAEIDEDTGDIYFGATASHSAFVEFGTEHERADGSVYRIPAQPFVRETAYKERGEYH